MRCRIQKDDLVELIAGKDRSSKNAVHRGRVLNVDHEKGRVTVEGFNMIRKAQKPRKSNEKGQLLNVEAALDVSNVMLVCSSCGPVRSSYSFDEAKRKVRICRKCKGAL